MKKLFKTIGIVAVNFFLATVFVVAVERALPFFVSLPMGNIIIDPRLNHTFRPNSGYLHREWIRGNPDFPESYRHHYNRQGWIETYNIEKRKPASTYRIFYLGDSFIEGTCPMDQSVPSIVERRLNGLLKDKSCVFEVINTGTSSYSPVIYYLLTRYVLMDYSPDLIVVNIDMTDVYDDLKYGLTLIRDRDGSPMFAPHHAIYSSVVINQATGTLEMTPWARIKLFIMRHSYTFNLMMLIQKRCFELMDTVEARGTPGLRGGSVWVRRIWSESTLKDVENTFDNLRGLVDWCRRHDIKIMFTAVPHYFQYAGDLNGRGEPLWSNRPHEALADLAKELGVPYLNSWAALAPTIQGTPQTAFYYKNDMHFNPRGYAVWAEAHIAFLTDRANRLLPEKLAQKRGE